MPKVSQGAILSVPNRGYMAQSLINSPDADRKTADMMPEYSYLLFSSQRTVEKFPKTAKIHRQNREISAILLCVFAKIINIIFHTRSEFKPTVNAPKARSYRELTAWTVAQNCGL